MLVSSYRVFVRIWHNSDFHENDSRHYIPEKEETYTRTNEKKTECWEKYIPSYKSKGKAVLYDNRTKAKGFMEQDIGTNDDWLDEWMSEWMTNWRNMWLTTAMQFIVWMYV